MRKERIVKGKNGVSFKIVEDTGETIEDLAIWMAEALGRKSYYERQAAAFRLQSQNERRKATDRNTLLFQLKEYNRQKKRDIQAGIVRKVSRMEPMETYDKDMLEQERVLFQSRANEFHKTADSFEDLARKEDIKVREYQQHIAELRKFDGSS
jgi:hypothetical protein